MLSMASLVVGTEVEMDVEMVGEMVVVEEVDVDLYQNNSVLQHTSKFAPASPNKAAGLCQDRNAQHHQNNNAALCQDSSADQFLEE